VILISHNMPHVFDVSDRIHIHRLGRRVAVVTPQSHSMSDAVAIMTGALESKMTEEEMSRPKLSVDALAAAPHVGDGPLTSRQTNA
jgi:ABC-type sugar transport system ATPase subunit